MESYRIANPDVTSWNTSSMEFNQPKVLELNAKKHVNMFAMLLIDKFIHFVAFYWRPQIATEYT